MEARRGHDGRTANSSGTSTASLRVPCPRTPAGAPLRFTTLTSVAANLAAILGGIVVFHEPVGSGPLEIGARSLAFCLVIAGAALMPAPTRATPDAG